MKVQSVFKTFILQIICIAMVVIVILPILLTLFAAFKTGADMVNTSPLALPPAERITFDNFAKVLNDRNLYTGFRNTLIILAVSLVFNVMFGTITAYIIERFSFRFKKFVVSLFFLGMLIPTFVTEISRFKIISGLGLYNTLGAPIVIYVASDLMQLYIYRQFISKISVSLDESAILDGCSYWGLFAKIIFPLLKPATATVCIIKSITIINEAGFLANTCCRDYYHNVADCTALHILPEVYSFRSCGRCGQGVICPQI